VLLVKFWDSFISPQCAKLYFYTLIDSGLFLPLDHKFTLPVVSNIEKIITKLQM